MTWSYLMMFSDSLGTRKEVQDFLNEIPEVTYWYSCVPHCVFFSSTLTAGNIAEKVHERFGKGSGFFLIMDANNNDRQGWLPKKVWHLFKNPEDPRLEE